jgi:hypothetical protein
MKLKHKKYGEFELPEPLTQDQLEQYYDKLKADKDKIEDMTMPRFRGWLVKAASELGWLPEVSRDDARLITWLGNELSKFIASYEDVDPN